MCALGFSLSLVLSSLPPLPSALKPQMLSATLKPVAYTIRSYERAVPELEIRPGRYEERVRKTFNQLSVKFPLKLKFL